MRIHSLISSANIEVTHDGIIALSEAQSESSVRDVLLQVADKIQEVELLIASGSLTTLPDDNGMKPAVFVAERLDGTVHVGWHHAPVDSLTGEQFHYDHGVGTVKNQDGQYIWFPSLTAFVNFTYNPKTNSFDGAWEKCEFDVTVKSPRSIHEVALVKALEGHIQNRPSVVYVTLSNPTNNKQPIETRRFELAY